MQELWTYREAEVLEEVDVAGFEVEATDGVGQLTRKAEAPSISNGWLTLTVSCRGAAPGSSVAVTWAVKSRG